MRLKGRLFSSEPETCIYKKIPDAAIVVAGPLTTLE